MQARPNKKDFSQWYDYVIYNADLIDIRYGVKGTVVYKPEAMDIIDSLYSLFESKLKERGHKKYLFPLFINYSSFKKEADHIKGFEEEVFMVNRAGGKDLEEPLIIRPTSETAFYPMFSIWIKSYRDLPMKTYQSVAVYRYETKATRPLFRGREFLWIETHNVFPSEEEAKRHVEEDISMMSEQLKDLGIPYLIVKREPFDRFPGADESYAYDAIMPNGEVLQVATTHYLGQNFTKPFEVKYLDQDGSYRIPYSTTLGIGITRILAAIISVHGDDYGLYIPPQLSSVKGIIVPILYGSSGDEVKKYMQHVIENAKPYVFIPDTGEETPGEKFYRSELYGFPLRIEVGRKEVENSTVTVYRRDTRKKVVVNLKDLKVKLDEIIEDMKKNLKNKSESLKDIPEAKNREEVLKLLKQHPIIKMDFCGRAECAMDLKKATEGYEVRGELVEAKEKAGERCAWCGEKALRKVIVAKSF
ncbi:MAG: proline--tRNA ligase [Nitrososphaeria archaeon]|nr:proline--tRNA ligase [Conexivisphaerales archaeon]